MQVTLDFGNQSYGSFEVALNAAHQNVARSIGTKAVMTLDWPFTGKDKNVSSVIQSDEEIQKLNYIEQTMKNVVMKN